MNLLLENKLAPITSEIGFLECDASSCIDTFIKWQSPLHAHREILLKKQLVRGDLENLLMMLFPLTSIERRRYLFVPTQSRWTAYFDSGWTGGDPASAVSYLAGLLGCRGVRAVCVPNTITRETPRGKGRYGAVMLELFGGPNKVGGNTKRSIYVSNDGGKWVFGAHGEQLEFEKSGSYQAKRVQDRFPPELLAQYMNALGIDIFSSAFYAPDGWANMASKVGPQVKGAQEFDYLTIKNNS